MKTIHPRHDADNSPESSNQLNEGEEISLGIVPKEDQSNDADQYLEETKSYHKITKIHNPTNAEHQGQQHDPYIAPHAQGDLSGSHAKDETTSEKILFEVQKHPKIDLTPDSEHSDAGEQASKQPSEHANKQANLASRRTSKQANGQTRKQPTMQTSQQATTQRTHK